MDSSRLSCVVKERSSFKKYWISLFLFGFLLEKTCFFYKWLVMKASSYTNTYKYKKLMKGITFITKSKFAVTFYLENTSEFLSTEKTSLR